jgi:uncharacterized protein YigE (DUF2233 family)
LTLAASVLVSLVEPIKKKKKFYWKNEAILPFRIFDAVLLTDVCRDKLGWFVSIISRYLDTISTDAK